MKKVFVTVYYTGTQIHNYRSSHTVYTFTLLYITAECSVCWCFVVNSPSHMRTGWWLQRASEGPVSLRGRCIKRQLITFRHEQKKVKLNHTSVFSNQFSCPSLILCHHHNSIKDILCLANTDENNITASSYQHHTLCINWIMVVVVFYL